MLGQNPLRAIVRAIDPSLPVSGALGGPTLELHDDNGTLIASNDNWRSDQETEIIATGVPPSNDLESAIVQNLVPGSYTAILAGANSTTGIAVVEAYGAELTRSGVSKPPKRFQWSSGKERGLFRGDVLDH